MEMGKEKKRTMNEQVQAFVCGRLIFAAIFAVAGIIYGLRRFNAWLDDQVLQERRYWNEYQKCRAEKWLQGQKCGESE